MLASLGACFRGSALDGLAILAISFAWEYLAMGDRVAAHWVDELAGDLACEAAFIIANLFLLARRGQTVGKALVGTRIVDLSGRRAGFWRIVVLRMVPLMVATYVPIYSLPMISAHLPPAVVDEPWVLLCVMLPLPILDAIFIFRADRRCLHDLIAGTRVVRVATPPNR